jgi:proline dehydrogenase
MATNAGQKAARALKRIARSETVKQHILSDPTLYSVVLRAAQTFIAGETRSDCLRYAALENAAGSAVTIDYMGENISDANAAREATEEFLGLVHAIDDSGLNASVSLDLSHIGLAVRSELAIENGDQIARAATAAGIEMMISAEGSERTDEVMAVHGQLARSHHDVGITLQVNLLRTVRDLDVVLGRPGKIRLVKGAFQEPGHIAMPRGPELDEAFLGAIGRVIGAGRPCSIGTHDPKIIGRVRQWFGSSPLAPGAEFEMLLGAAPDNLARLRRSGLPTRVYLPYGKEWYLYLCHRLAEHPPNIYAAIANAVKTSQA